MDLTRHSRPAQSRHLLTRPVGRFIAIGIVSTLAYALWFLALSGPLGSVGANALALVITAVANTAANRRLTFGVRGRASLLRDHLGGLAIFALSLAMTDAALALLGALDPHPVRMLELAVLITASLCATATRYVAMSTVLFRTGRHPLRSVHSLSTQGS